MPPFPAVARQIVEIALLRRSPSDVPYSTTLLGVVVAVSAAASLGAAHMQALSPMAVLVILVYTAAFAHGVLQMKGLAHRFVQTATALFGTDALLTLIALPLLNATVGAGGDVPPTLVLAYLGLLVWNVAIVAHILRHALDTRFGTAVFWAVAFLAGTTILAGLFGG